MDIRDQRKKDWLVIVSVIWCLVMWTLAAFELVAWWICIFATIAFLGVNGCIAPIKAKAEATIKCNFGRRKG